MPFVEHVPPGRHRSRHEARTKSPVSKGKNMPQNQTDAEIEYDDLMRRLERIEAQVRHGAQCAARDPSAILNTSSAVENLDATMNHLTNGLAQNVLRPINKLTKLFENQQNVLARHEALLERHEKGLVALLLRFVTMW